MYLVGNNNNILMLFHRTTLMTETSVQRKPTENFHGNNNDIMAIYNHRAMTMRRSVSADRVQHAVTNERVMYIIK